jgi:uncharacterized protein YutE (UPF0331/DUF86 family)
MVDRDLVLAKVDTLERCIARIQDVHGPAHAGLRPVDVQDITVLNLQRAVQAMIDLAAHLVASERLGLPDSLGASFTLLERAGLLEPVLAERMRRMTGFRNVAVHAYRQLDPAIVESIVRERLGDLRAFARGVLARFGIAGEAEPTC